MSEAMFFVLGAFGCALVFGLYGVLTNYNGKRNKPAGFRYYLVVSHGAVCAEATANLNRALCKARELDASGSSKVRIIEYEPKREVAYR